ncbi:RHO1 GDP-GTP exchange protein 2 [Coemansia sp. RSA 353]|nr:RHO1 GDP-GTP exchange protein 2 [Coemansia sp. RSA 562]KAJ2227772.1 RHO1 GDP-GTP exchange protein 2 [Coemansia sp. RSA 518]KAJ2281354.1 RHO1 GDP-GTP exchange protein 2 [Coemansia sp. RSA 370]KAJ2293703.1 RHO1 GDP-GTP exchange protein 2 [Coemansia sp. RSA 355]KAJ2301654.1 RHO1 GDP-GTP exchange protein 2 [Coemansia sp. RSA 353]
MATAQSGPAGASRRLKGSSLTSWLKKGASTENADAKKLASPAEEIKMVFLRQLKLSSFELDGRQYHSVFTGEQIVDIILDHFKLPDRKLAANVASRLIDCSLYTHVSGPSAESDQQGTVIDSTAEIYTLTAEAHDILKSLNKGEALQRAKTQTRKRYNDLRSHLHPRTTSSSQSHVSSRSSIHRSRSTVSAASRDTKSNEGRTQSSPPPPVAPLDVRRSVAESITLGGIKRWSTDSPSETLVAHVLLAADASDTALANGNRCSDGTATPTIPEVDIPTGEFDGLLSTWRRSAEPESTDQDTPELMSLNGDEDEHESTPSLGESSDTAEPSRDSVGADESTAGSDIMQQNSQVLFGEWEQHQQQQRNSQALSLTEWGQHQQRWGSESIRRRGSSIFSNDTSSRRMSLPGAPRQTDSESVMFTQACDAWLDEMAYVQRQSVDESQLGCRARNSIASTHHSDSVACASVMQMDVWPQRQHARRYSTGTQMLGSRMFGRDGEMTPSTPQVSTQQINSQRVDPQRIGIAATTAETVATDASRSTASVNAFFSSSIPHFPRPRTAHSTDTRSDMDGVNEDSRRNSKGATLRRRHITPDALESRARAESVGERASSVTLSSDDTNRRVSCTMQLQLWRDTVPAALMQELGSEAVARQEAIFEIISTEHGYLRDLQLIHTLYVEPLLSEHAVELSSGSVAEFVDMLFFNYRELEANSMALCAQLRERQAASPVVATVGDIFDAWADNLDSFIEYAVHVPDAQCGLEAELLCSAAMGQFLQRAEETPAARRLPVQSFIGRPATRLARYPLLLDAIARRTPVAADAEQLHSAAAKVRAALGEIDRRTGEAAAQLRIRQISQRLQLVAGARESLALDSPTRRLEREGVLQALDGSGQVLVFLFDNSLIMATEERVPHARGVSQYVADDRIIPISMLDAAAAAAEPRALARMFLAQQSATARAALTFEHIGCSALSRTLVAASAAERDAWVRAVRRRVRVAQTLVEAHTDSRVVSDRDFAATRAPLCSAAFVSLLSGCQMALYGSRDGLHMGIYGVPTSVVRVSAVPVVTRIHVMKRFNMVIVLSDSTLLCFALTEIEKAAAAAGGGVSAAKLASGVAFFDVGAFLGRPLIVLMKPRGGRSQFKCLQPSPRDEPDVGGTLRTVYSGPDACLRLVGEFAVGGRATKVHFLRRKLCVVGARGFDVVDVQQARVLRSLPDPLDDDFSFVPAAARALAVCKVGREFLLCYDTCAFFIDNFGRRSRPDVFVRWEMRPHAVTFRPPYVVAVNTRFLEVRHIETGVLLSIIRIPHTTCLNPDSRSTVLHIAVGPEPVGVPADDEPSTSAEPSSSFSADGAPESESHSACDDASAVSVPVTRPASMALLKPSSQLLRTPFRPPPRHVVPGLGGASGTRLFPEGTPGHCRIIEIRLPPLKSSGKTGS